MPDVLKETLYWASAQAHDQGDVNGCVPTFTTMSLAQSHDASDTTYAQLATSDDAGNVINADSWAWNEAHVDTSSATGAISYVRVKIKARRATTAGTGPVTYEWSPYINGTRRGNLIGLSTSFTWMTEDFAVDPADGLAWTPAKINAQKFGYEIRIVSSDGAYGTAGNIRVSEVELEVYGPGVQTSTPGAALVASASGSPSAILGPVSSAPDATSVASASSGPTSVVGGVTSAPASVAVQSVTAYGADVSSQTVRVATVVTPQASMLNTSGGPITVRSFKASLSDQTTATRDIHTSTGSGTQLQPLYGAGSQGLQGLAIRGSGTIVGIKLFAIVRVSKQASGTISNVRFGTSMGTKSLVTPATIRDYDAGLTDDMWETVQTAIITTGSTGQPFVWGNGANSVWAQLFGWTFNYTYGGTGTKQLEVAEAWVEIHGAIGTAPTEIGVRGRITNFIVSSSIGEPIDG